MLSGYKYKSLWYCCKKIRSWINQYFILFHHKLRTVGIGSRSPVFLRAPIGCLLGSRSPVFIRAPIGCLLCCLRFRICRFCLCKGNCILWKARIKVYCWNEADQQVSEENTHNSFILYTVYTLFEYTVRVHWTKSIFSGWETAIVVFDISKIFSHCFWLQWAT